MNDENVVFKGSPSIVTRCGALLLGFLVAAGAATGFFLINDPPAVKYGLGVLAVIALIHMIVTVILVKATQYEVTSERIRVRHGILTKRTDELELYRVNDTSLIEPLSLRMLGLGTIEVRTMDTSNPTLFLHAVHGARNLREELRKYVEQCRDKKGVRVTEFDNPSPEGA